MTISVRMTNKEGELIKRFAEMKGITVSELVRQSVMQRIEDDIYINNAINIQCVFKVGAIPSQGFVSNSKYDDWSYTLKRENKNGKWKIVEGQIGF